jgi:acyl-coenzyme A synthetase/AMP-(fatty) acid ligase
MQTVERGYSFSAVSSDDLLALLYTSGTTGTPKGTMHTHQSLLAPVVASAKLRELWLKRPNLATLGKMAVALVRYRERLLRTAGRPQCFLSTTSWHTITGLESMLQALLMGDRLVAMPRFHPRRALELIERERVTILIAVPTALQVMLSVQEATQDAYDVSSLLICGTGAAPCPPHLAHEVQSRFGCAIHIGFGATETAGGISATSLADSDARQAESVGRPMPGVEIKVVDESRHELDTGQIGELACRSKGVMLGYYRAPKATAQVIDEEGWYYTGDLARIDEDGYVHIVGRIKDVIIRGGQNIYPAEIEAYLAAHDGIREAAVVGMPSAVGGESVWAFVLLQEGVKMTGQEVLAYCRQELEPSKIPSQVRFVADFPRTETGKPKKFELRQAFLSTGNAEQSRRGS